MMRNIHKFAITLATLAVALCPVSGLRADFTASGTFQYQDRTMYSGGFTGDEPYRPIRLADVEILDNTTSAILATGFTDTTGYFSINVTDSQIRDVVVRVLTSTDYCPVSNRTTVSWNGGYSNWGDPYALESQIYSSHNPSTDIDIGTVGATSDLPGKPFNIFDIQLDEMTWVLELQGGNMGDYDLFRARWADGIAPGQAYFNGTGITLGSEVAYDDCDIGHEGGHFVNDRWSRDNNPGGTHYLGDNNQDPRLSWGEGIASYYPSMTRELLGRDPAPNLYVRTTGAPGPGNLSFTYDIESPPGTYYGPANEVVITSVVYDINDGVDTPDDDPGIDDDALDLPYAEPWEVLTDYLPSNGNPRTVEDFWDGWFDPTINNGYETEMLAIFGAFQIEYYEDNLEPDSSMTLATPLNFLDDAVHHTLYGVGDEDWHQLDIIDNASFRVRSAQRSPATYPAITVYDSDGVTEIATNWDDISQAVTFDGVGSGPYYAKAVQKDDWGIYTEYGHFDLDYDITQAPPESAQIQLSPTAIIQTASIGETVSDTAIIYNIGGGSLNYSISDKERFGEDPADLPWLTEDPSSGTVDPGDSIIVTVTFITDDLTPDSSYDALIVVESNDIVTPVEEIIVRLTTQGILGIGDGNETASSASLPRAFAMAQNYPNPFNPSTSIAYDIPAGHEDGVKVHLEVFNVRGQKVATLVDGVKMPGSYVVQWNGKDDTGRTTGSGIYIYRLKAGDFSSTKKMVILK